MRCVAPCGSFLGAEPGVALQELRLSDYQVLQQRSKMLLEKTIGKKIRIAMEKKVGKEHKEANGKQHGE